MYKSIVVCAVLGGSAALASAQGTVNAYGVIDAGVVRNGGCGDSCTMQVASGVASESRVGIRGSEQLGQDMSAIFALESVFDASDGRVVENGEMAGGQAWVGLAGRFGALTVGRQHNLEYETLQDVGDPFRAGMAGSATNLIGTGGRSLDDTVIYRAKVRGVTAGASWTRGKLDSSKAGRAWGMSLGISHGALTLRIAHQNRNVAKVHRVNDTGLTMAAKNSIIAANLRLGWGTAYAAYSASRGWGSSPLFNPDNPYGASMADNDSTDSRDVLVGLAVPLGHATTLLASVISKNDREPANRDARQFAIGATYAVSPRLDFYAAWSRIENTNGASYSVGNASGRGSGNSAVNVGMRHAF